MGAEGGVGRGGKGSWGWWVKNWVGLGVWREYLGGGGAGRGNLLLLVWLGRGGRGSLAG